MMHSVHIRFYEELNDLLPPELRKTRFVVSCPEPRSVKDLIESQGVPHTEVDLVLANGESVGFDHVVRDGDDVAVYPVFESFDIRNVSRLRRSPLRRVRFIADVHLGKLVRRLRLLGFDCLYDTSMGDPELAEISHRQNRVLLTRDKGLLMRSMVTHGIYIRSDRAQEQVRQVVDRLHLQNEIKPWSRCLTCNGLLETVERESVRDDVPEFTYRTQSEFHRCRTCGKVFWAGSHWSKLQRFIEEVRN
jgi:uncharacterized protein with PIN domain/sulfur carrier protein ThiS